MLLTFLGICIDQGEADFLVKGRKPAAFQVPSVDQRLRTIVIWAPLSELFIRTTSTSPTNSALDLIGVPSVIVFRADKKVSKFGSH